jgi:hypothetical protein
MPMAGNNCGAATCNNNDSTGSSAIWLQNIVINCPANVFNNVTNGFNYVTDCLKYGITTFDGFNDSADIACAPF